MSDGRLLISSYLIQWVEGEPTASGCRIDVYPDLFPRFFDQAIDHLAENGRIVMVFSTAINLLQPDAVHPIEAELKRGRLKLVQKQNRRVKPSKSADGRRRKSKERVEVWELQVNDI